MNAGNNNFKTFQDFIWIIQSTIIQNIRFNSFDDGEFGIVALRRCGASPAGYFEKCQLDAMADSALYMTSGTNSGTRNVGVATR